MRGTYIVSTNKAKEDDPMAYKVDENGNYQRSVRCGHCYEVGHNRSSCSKRKQNLMDNIARYTKELEEDNFSEDWYKENTKRYLKNSKEELERMTKKGKKRSCGFCHESGHTRRTCPKRKVAVQEYARELTIARQKLIDNLRDRGIFVGALIETHRDKAPAIITDIQLDRLGLNNVISSGHFYRISLVTYDLIVPQKNSWGQTISSGICSLPQDVLNINNVPDEEVYRSASSSFDLLSAVNLPDNAFDKAINYKEIEKFAIDCIDPR